MPSADLDFILRDSLRIVRGLGTNLLYVEDDEGSIRLDAAEAERLAIALIQATPQPVYAPDPGGRFTREVALKIGLALIRLAKERP